jgi:hypothetical protein
MEFVSQQIPLQIISSVTDRLSGDAGVALEGPMSSPPVRDIS